MANSAPRPSFWLAVYTLAAREVVRFVRQRSRLVGAIGQPIIFWILFGAGLSGSFQFGAGEGAMSYQEYFLPGIAILIVLFTSIFASISVIQDRNEGFLQGVLVAPVPRTAIVLGKVLGGTFLALLQAALFVFVAPLLRFVGLAPDMHLAVSLTDTVSACGFLLMVAIGLNSLGYLFAWKIDSVQGFHGIMSVVLLPMWLLSGAFFPGTGSRWVSFLIQINPLSYGVAGLRRSLSAGSTALNQLPSLATCWIVVIAFAVVCLGIDIWLTRRHQAA